MRRRDGVGWFEVNTRSSSIEELPGVLSPKPGEDPTEKEREAVSGFLWTGECNGLTGGDFPLRRCFVGGFAVVRERSSRSLEKVGQ